MNQGRLRGSQSLILALLLFAAVSGIFLFVEQHHFFLLLGLYSIGFAGYLLLYRYIPNSQVKWLWILVISIRCMSFLQSPQLSDDYYRFYWDAKVADTGASVYAYTPSVFLDKYPGAVSQEVYDKLNSPDYYSVYPPLLQTLYRTAYSLSNGSLPSFVFWLRGLFFVIEMMILALLYFGLRHKRKWVLYALNPLIIIELTGNLHAELLVAGGIILVFVKAKQNWSYLLSAGMAVGAKLSPIILYPPILMSKQKRDIWKISLLSILMLGVLFFPLWWDWELGANFLSSIRLYYQSFEFNGSLYLVARELLSLYYGFNPIAILGPGLQIMAAIIILALYSRHYFLSKVKLSDTLIQVWLIYLLFSTTVHPWYIIPAIAILPFRMSYGILAWSFSIVFSYIYYANASDGTVIFFHILEYLFLFIGLSIDLSRSKIKPT
jgi:hypothetical protein